MQKKLPEDADSDYFFRELIDTPPGKRFYRSWLCMKVRRVEILRIMRALNRRELNTGIAAAQIAENQRAYIDYSTEADEALDELTRLYHWPTDSTADESFQWRPRPKERRRQSRS